MNTKKILELISFAELSKSEKWAIFGVPNKNYVYAIADVLGLSGQVHAVDKSKRKLAVINPEVKGLAKINLENKDFLAAKLFDDLDGVFLPYSLHKVANPMKFLGQVMLSIKVDGKLLILDYNTQRANPRLKYPVDIKRLNSLTKKLALPEPKILQKTRARFGRESYLAQIKIPDLRS